MKEKILKHKNLIFLFSFLFLFNSTGAKAANITTVQVKNNGATGSLSATFGQVFKIGDIPSSQFVGVTNSDGSAVAGYQVDIKNRHADGSIKYAVITADIGNVVNGTIKTLWLNNSASVPSNTAIDKTIWLADNPSFDENISLIIGGTTWIASARTMLANQAPQVWLSGPEVTEWIVGGPLLNGATPHAHLAAYFHIRVYKGNGKARVDAVIENGWTQVANPTSYAIASATISIPGKSDVVYSNLTQYHHTRWSHDGWWGTAQDLFVKHDTQYLRNTYAVPNYDNTLTVSATTLGGYTQTYTPMARGNFSSDWSSAGYQPSIGLLTEREAAYIISGDERAYKAVLTDARSAGSFSFHYRDDQANKGGVPSVFLYPTMTMQTWTLVKQGGGTANPLLFDREHSPSIGFLAYLLTGEYQFLEELMFHSNYVQIWAAADNRKWDGSSYDYGSGTERGIIQTGGTVRQFAWALRNLAQTTYAIPDTFAIGAVDYKAYFKNLWDNNMAFNNNRVSPSNTAFSTLGVLADWNNEPSHNPWEDDFVAATISYSVGMGFTNGTTFRNWLNRYPAGRMGIDMANEWCYLYATEYDMSAGAVPSRGKYDASGNWYTSYRQAYVGYMGAKHPTVDVNSCPAGQQMQSAAHPDEATGYYSNMQPALAMAVDAGQATFTQWQRFVSAGASNMPSLYSAAPVWAIVPRASFSSDTTPPASPVGLVVF